MKTLILKTCALSFLIALSSFSVKTQAQQNIGTLPPIIDLILNDTPQGNSPPINTVPPTTAQSPLQFDFGVKQSQFLVSVNDVDGNLASIRVDTGRAGLIGINPNSDVGFEPIFGGFIITGSQENLIQAISVISYSPILSPDEGDAFFEVTITSTDSIGEVDQDSFFVNFNYEND